MAKFDKNIKISHIRKIKNRFFNRESKYVPAFSTHTLSVDKVYNERRKFWIAILYRKIGRKVTFDFGGP